ncbi:MAG: hypothetical protein ABIV43_03495 [Candidatus Saccharimonadales bacterium]
MKTSSPELFAIYGNVLQSDAYSLARLAIRRSLEEPDLGEPPLSLNIHELSAHGLLVDDTEPKVWSPLFSKLQIVRLLLVDQIADFSNTQSVNFVGKLELSAQSPWDSTISKRTRSLFLQMTNRVGFTSKVNDTGGFDISALLLT